jgi:hypothetical protein
LAPKKKYNNNKIKRVSRDELRIHETSSPRKKSSLNSRLKLKKKKRGKYFDEK